MHLLIATGIFPPDIGGPATYSKTVAEEFSKRGHQVTVITYSSAKDVEAKSYKLKVISSALPKGIRHVVYFWNVLQVGRRADIMYAQDAVSAGFPAMIASLMLRKRFFLKVVGDHAWEQGVQCYGVTELLDDFLTKTYGVRVALLRFFRKRTARRAEKIIVPSTYLKSVVERWGIPSERIAVIPNAISLPATIFTKEEARGILGLDGFLLVTVGRLVPWKGFRMLVELMPDLITIIPNAKLIVIGSGPEEETLKIISHNLNASVVFTGAMLKDQLFQYLAAADVCCLNTSYEGFSHQLVEALAVGVPVITTSAGGNKEVVRDGENALVAEYNNPKSWKGCVLRLYEDRELRDKLSQKNNGVIECYSIGNMIQKTESIILNS
ncbi:MAG: hypothetical protein A3J54_01320 [Candidatus Ryanbacteria bacterium RIFCSPHIGHO2_02_FULL_45_13b]|uniref:Glycosyltransferase subfamily 4-like N-terminal domain-containing protein n=1 Tax=Candidatus Ryanbacteria bacterium RIFCSPHIGHO2_02_FULL_45_13b TaxID=1802117 RepID=A0A1G2GBF1_9BACT|nr:MAG: hypothetical protein A3J54_01320 [Candidatus Ryanbacteria bacterium RIFCSPHIGHO2_02_FULL_45_13b]